MTLICMLFCIEMAVKLMTTELHIKLEQNRQNFNLRIAAKTLMNPSGSLIKAKYNRFP